jgi:ADP-heptose:LPS heptosyltransferase
MGPLLERLPSGSRIAVIRLRSLGDCVLTTPALALLKEYRPDLGVGVVVDDRFRAVFEHHPDVQEIIAPRAADIARWSPHLVLNLHGGTRSMGLTLASRSGYRAGFAHHRFSFIYSHRIPRAQEILGEERPVHTAEHIASAMFWLGLPHRPIPRAKLSAGPPPAISSGGYAVIHPFASQPDKTWPAERFLAVAEHLRGAS